MLATQSLAVDRLKVKNIEVTGELQKGVYAKDIILAIIRELGVGGGKGFAYEYSGDVIKGLSIEGRLTLCNMSIEGGALVGYVNPDNTTFEFLKGRKYAPKGDSFERAVRYWSSIASKPYAKYDETVTIDGKKLEPIVTWGTNPGLSVRISENLPLPEKLDDPEGALKAYKHMGFEPGQPMYGIPINVAFIGACTNSRLEDLKEASKVAYGRRVADGVRALVVPGSQEIKYQAELEGLDKIFTDAGFEWRRAGCSMCLGMNPDKLIGREICASSSNRNFVGRQGSPEGRTLLMSPAMVAAAAIEGRVTDVRQYL